MVEQTASLKKKKKLKKRLIIGGVVLILLAALILPGLLSAGAAKQMITLSDTAAVCLTDLTRSISATGTVESANSTSVYSTLAYTVKAVHVKVGDAVEEGQLLAELDEENIRNSISSQQVSSSAQMQSADAQVKSAQDTYDSFKEGIDSGLNPSLLSAQTQLDNAYNAYMTAQTNLQRFEHALATGQNTTLISARAALDNAQAALTSAQNAYHANSNDQTLQALTAAQTAYESAEASYHAAQSSVNNTLDDLRVAVSTAQNAYETAQISMESTQKAVNDQLQGYADALAAAKTGTNTATANESVRQLRKTLSDTKITAPCAGTVTAVYATVGASGSGLLFVIEDVEHLIVKTSVKSYDVGSVSLGQKVLLTTDATGDEEFTGTVSFLAPTTKKNTFGETDAVDSVFEAEVTVTSENTPLKIGMEAQLSYVVSEVKDVLTVPYEAVYENENGHSCVLIALQQQNGKYLLQETVVKTGLDDDLDIEVSAPELSEGTLVIQTPDKYRDLVGMELTENTATQGAWQVMMQ